MLRSLFGRKSIKDIKSILPRDYLIRNTRILFIDDEEPELINDLKNAKFSVDYLPDITSNDQHRIENNTYDLVILDFGGVGKDFGKDEGLSLLHFIKRVSPATIVIAYTSKSLYSNQAAFFRDTDYVLSKDAGIADSTEKIEEALQKALSTENLWKSFLFTAGIKPESTLDKKWQNLYASGIDKKTSLDKFKNTVLEYLKDDTIHMKAAKIVFDKLIAIGTTYING